MQFDRSPDHHSHNGHENRHHQQQFEQGEPALPSACRARFVRPVLVDGVVGAVLAPRGKLSRVLRFTIKNGRIAEVDIVADPAR